MISLLFDYDTSLKLNISQDFIRFYEFLFAKLTYFYQVLSIFMNF